MEFEFLLVVTGISIDDDDATAIIMDEFDGVLADHRGSVRLAVSAEGTDPISTLAELVIRLANRLPEMSVLRLDPDLVGISDIAERTGHSRQNVQQWVDGGRRNHKQPFPDSEGTVGRSLVWRWSDVYGWLRPQKLVEQENVPSRTDALRLDLWLMNWMQSRVEGRPLVKTLMVDGDDLGNSRRIVANAVNANLAIGDPDLTTALQAIPRENQHQITIVCAATLDPLRFVVDQLGSEVSGVIAVQTSDSQLRFLPISSVQLPWSKPISELGLSDNATVGDLVLALDTNLVGKSRPLVVSGGKAVR